MTQSLEKPVRRTTAAPAGGSNVTRQLWFSRWPILGVTVLAAGAGLAYCLLTTPVYRASTSLLIEPKEANVVEIDKVYETQGIVREYHRTQYELLRSKELLQAVIEKLKLAENPVYAEFTGMAVADPSFMYKVKQEIKALIAKLRALLQFAPADDEPDGLLEEVIDNLQIDPVPNTYLVQVTFKAPEPKLSADVANAVVAEYMQRDRANRVGIGYEAADWLTQRVDESRVALQASEQALQKFLEKEDLVNVGGSRGLIDDEITEQSRRLRDARQQREALANVYAKIRAAGPRVELLQEIPRIQDDPLVRDTKFAYLSAKEALDQIGPRYGDKHPSRIAAQARFQAAERAYFTQLRIRAEGIRSEYELADSTQASLQGAVDRSMSRIQNLDRKDYSLKSLQREVDTNRELYDTFLKRFKETQATADLQFGNARIIDVAQIPTTPSWPRKGLLLAGSTLLGLMLGCGLVLLRNALDSSIHDTEELEQLTSLPILCSLPRLKGSKAAANRLVRLELDDPKSLYSEGVRTLRTSILLSDRPGQPTRRIMVCSSLPEEGKTSISSNLAIVLAERERVLLIDADLRKPRLGGLFKVKPEHPGLPQVLSGEATLEDALISFESGNVDLLVAGKTQKNPQVLLASERFQTLLEELARRYDRIIFDTAPCQLVSDTLLFARHVDAAILVARADSTPGKVVASTARLLRQAEAPILGAVLNYVDTRRAQGSEGGYYYRYGYYG